MLRNQSSRETDERALSNVELSRVEDTIDRIRYFHRNRVYAMEQRKRSDLALGAFLRTSLGWSLALPDEERKEIAARAAAIEPDDPEWGHIIRASHAAREPFSKIEKESLKEMERLAADLPVFPFVGTVRGFGPASLAVIIAETGDIGKYATVAKLWKRMGLAVMDGLRQGGLPAGSAAEMWVAHGYAPKRRSMMWNIGDALIKGNRDGEYRAVYLARKEYELAREPGMAPIKAHRRAQRYMEKRLLKHLWQAWRRTIIDQQSMREASDAWPPGHEAVGQPELNRLAAKNSRSAHLDPISIELVPDEGTLGPIYRETLEQGAKRPRNSRSAGGRAPTIQTSPDEAMSGQSMDGALPAVAGHRKKSQQTFIEVGTPGRHASAARRQARGEVEPQPTPVRRRTKKELLR